MECRVTDLYCSVAGIDFFELTDVVGLVGDSVGIIVVDGLKKRRSSFGLNSRSSGSMLTVLWHIYPRFLSQDAFLKLGFSQRCQSRRRHSFHLFFFSLAN